MPVVALKDPTTHPPIGAIAFGQAGVPYQVIDRWRDKTTGKFWVAVATDRGDNPIELSRVARWEMPALAFKPGDRVVIQVGDRFRHHGKVGTVRNFDASDNAYQVNLDDGYQGWWRSEFLQLQLKSH